MLLKVTGASIKKVYLQDSSSTKFGAKHFSQTKTPLASALAVFLFLYFVLSLFFRGASHLLALEMFFSELYRCHIPVATISAILQHDTCSYRNILFQF